MHPVPRHYPSWAGILQIFDRIYLFMGLCVLFFVGGLSLGILGAAYLLGIVLKGLLLAAVDCPWACLVGAALGLAWWEFLPKPSSETTTRRAAVVTLTLPADPPPRGECPICLRDFRPGENISVGKHCGHAFHEDCLGKWCERSASCPCCRHNLEEEEEAPPSRYCRAAPKPPSVLDGLWVLPG